VFGYKFEALSQWHSVEHLLIIRLEKHVK